MNVLSLSYGKDSLACLGACDLLGWKIDRIIHAEIYATSNISADLPPMVEFKKKADKIIFDRFGLVVEHLSANVTYEDLFYKVIKKDTLNKGRIYGFPFPNAPWCNSGLKMPPLKYLKSSANDIFQILGIAADETIRIERHKNKSGVLLPLVEIGWTETDAKKWCIDNELLSPIYTDTCLRGGCWFCHNQSVEQLRQLRHNYPELWKLLLKWDNDSPVSFRSDGKTVHDFDRRFQAEDDGFIFPSNSFRWSELDFLQYNVFNWG